MTIGRRLYILRTDAKMSQDAFGELMCTPEKPTGVTKQAVGAWENGRNQLNANQVVRACEIFETTPTWLLTGQGEKHANTAPNPIKQGDIPVNLDYFTDREKALITIFREADEKGRAFLEDQAGAVPRKRINGGLAGTNDNT